MAEKLYVAFIWHMHQPYYRDTNKKFSFFPWVRLHAIKNYYNMVSILKDFPKIKQTFNLVPSLVLQIQEYLERKTTDDWLEKTLIPAHDLSEEDKKFILDNFFLLNIGKMISPFERFRELYEKRQKGENYTEQDFLDLQTLYNLAWFDPDLREKDTFLKSLCAKGRSFTEEEKIKLIDKQFEIMSAILSLYKGLQELGQIEVIFSPFFHPILPLLIDTNSAKIATPDLPLPSFTFRYKEDAKSQISLGKDFYKNIFGKEPLGMWPSEEAVSPEVVELSYDLGIKWLISDEKILFRTISKDVIRNSEGFLSEPYILYKPYRININGKYVDMVFRDQFLSDRIGFVYMNFSPYDGAKDLFNRLLKIKESLPDGNFIVTIALDGENCWEYYDNDGRDFLRYLYNFISESSEIETITVGDFLNKFPPQDELNTLFTGSWVDTDLTTWIGEKEENIAWDYLSIVRNFIERKLRRDPELKNKLDWTSLYAAEGSDWFWWYGDDQDSGHDEIFDQIFRNHLKNVYTSLGITPPSFLDIPIVIRKPLWQQRESFISTPVLDGKITHSSEWDLSSLNLLDGPQNYIKGIYYTYDLDNLYLRLDFRGNLKELFKENFSIRCYFSHPQKLFRNRHIRGRKESFCFPIALELNIFNDDSEILLAQGDENWQVLEKNNFSVINDIVEIKIPLSLFEGRKGEKINFGVCLFKDNDLLEILPDKDAFLFIIPGLLEEIITKLFVNRLNKKVYGEWILIPNRDYHNIYSKFIVTQENLTNFEGEENYDEIKILRKILIPEELIMILQTIRDYRSFNVSSYTVPYKFIKVEKEDGVYRLIPRESFIKVITQIYERNEMLKKIFKEKFRDASWDKSCGSIEIYGL